MYRLCRSYALVGLLVASYPVWATDGIPVTVESIGLDLDSMPVAVTDIEGVQENLFTEGRVFIGGQPSEDALAAFKARGVTVVVNLRTPGEMENREVVPFDEAAAVAGLEMEYVWIPSGGPEHPYGPVSVERFAEVLSEHDGPVLLHCTMAWRASYLWTAYLIEYQNVPLRAALTRGEAIAIPPTPLEGFLGTPLTLAYDQASD